MRIAVPAESKTLEGRVALVPSACADLVRQGHEVFVQENAGKKSGFSNDQYRRVGVQVLESAQNVYDAGELIVKVKEPIEGDLALLRKDHVLFCYLHLAAEPKLTRRLLDIGLCGVAFESVQEADGSLPLLAPMSIIAGRIAVQIGTQLLHQPAGGKGKLLGGLPSTDRGRVVVLGGGAAGRSVASLAAAGGSNVIVFEKRQDRLAQMMELGPNVTALYPFEDDVAKEISTADLVVGAVLVPSARAPHVVTRSMIKTMEPGSVFVDIAIDQGGCAETSKPTTYVDPTYVVDGVTHFAVTNMPGAVPQTSSHAISSSILQYVQRIAAGRQWRRHTPLVHGVNIDAGRVIHPALENAAIA